VSRPCLENNLPVLYCAYGFGEQAAVLSRNNGFTFAGESEAVATLTEPLVLWFDASGLSLRQTGRNAMGPVRCEFAAGEARHRRLYGGGKSQPIAKAVGVRDGIRPRIADLTAGLGGDACALAGIGCSLVMVERHPVVAALLEDGLQRLNEAAIADPDLQALAGNLSLLKVAAADWLESLTEEQRPDVIYLDPMFPERRKSAKVNKNMQIFHQLVGEDSDADSLLPLALARARYRVVVKRPSHAPCLNGQEPGVCLKGKSVRFDVYPLKRLV